MPVQFLEQLFSTLRRDGLLLSQRGVKGGYTLARPPEEITVLEVVQSLDGSVGEEAARPAASGRRASSPCATSSADDDRRHRPPRGRGGRRGDVPQSEHTRRFPCKLPSRGTSLTMRGPHLQAARAGPASSEPVGRRLTPPRHLPKRLEQAECGSTVVSLGLRSGGCQRRCQRRSGGRWPPARAAMARLRRRGALRGRWRARLHRSVRIGDGRGQGRRGGRG